MGIDEVKKEILSSARQQAKSLMKEGEKERDEIMAAVEAKIAEIAQRMESDTAKAVEQYKLLSSAEAGSQVRRQRISVEKRLIESVFEEAKQGAFGLPRKTRDTHNSKLLDAAGKELDVETVYCSKQDIDSLKKFKPKETDIIGGVIVESKDGSMRLDLSYETLLDGLRQEALPEITKILFE
ncbi:MAG: hypothetical protein HGA85_03985 [Nanoarchaeota archaeon]|nr:hypothetical protein [Nanoarchaeota archaeon]